MANVEDEPMDTNAMGGQETGGLFGTSSTHLIGGTHSTTELPATQSSTHSVRSTLSRRELDSLHLHLEESELLGNYYEGEEEEEEELREAAPAPAAHSMNDSDLKKK